MRAMSPPSNTRRRVKSRKQRFLSLSRELAASTPRSQKPPGPAAPHAKPSAKPRPPARRLDRSTVNTRATTASAVVVAEDKPLDLFPMHPDPQPLEEDDHRHAAAFFDDPDYYATTATLTSLLGPDHDNHAEAAPDDTFSVPAAAAVPHSPASSSPVYGAAAPRDLARSVLRGRERWVLCQQQGEEDQEEEGEASSCCGGGVAAAVDHRSPWWVSMPQRRTQLCFLKLDYAEVLSAWSGAGSVYVEGEAAQVVPDSYQHHNRYLQPEQPAVFVEVGGGSGGATGSDSSGSNLWVVPEDSSVGGREARVLRYKEKRQNRLFAKRIRYEVRKLNAQKRPRIKGRFVKRTQEQAC